jgi:hypothetical protein
MNKDLHQRIRAAQIAASEMAVIDDLRRRGLATDTQTTIDEAMDRVCGVLLNNGRAVEECLTADECKRIVLAALGNA